MTAKCNVCKKKNVVYIWQPFGLENLFTFYLPGWQQRGFPAIKVCACCHADILLALLHPDAPAPFVFHYKGVGYCIDHGIIKETPF